jgi:hypothetical protein
MYDCLSAQHPTSLNLIDLPTGNNTTALLPSIILKIRKDTLLGIRP